MCEGGTFGTPCWIVKCLVAAAQDSTDLDWYSACHSYLRNLAKSTSFRPSLVFIDADAHHLDILQDDKRRAISASISGTLTCKDWKTVAAVVLCASACHVSVTKNREPTKWSAIWSA